MGKFPEIVGVCPTLLYPALTSARPCHYIAVMAKNYRTTTTAAQDSGKDKEYEKHVCGECKRCTPVTAFHTLTVKDRKPTLGRCPEHKYCVLLSQQAEQCFSMKTKAPDSV